ncbi:pre-mRNA-splicing factor CWC22 homolog [Corticium candelabrum]|uniref:pre-mRNA-splicing factor CWC22 homolog n=1 Tax=Corticium candelabrum TaxID=121492 RepID=UPI002E264360|nr:pre-mRNA-splicing factor CWC22 homolog [Corticium candelabrum]
MGRHKRKHTKSSGNSESDGPSEDDSSVDSDTSSASISRSSDVSDTKRSVKVQSKKKRKKRKEQEGQKKLSKKRNSLDPITKHDFFEKSSEFRLWLIEKRHRYFDELSNSDSRKLFKKFVVRWNSGKLNKKYYEGIPVSELQKTVRTRYKWKFASKLDDFEQDTIRDSVITCTAGNSKVENLLFSTGKPTVEKSQVRGPIGPTLPPVTRKSGSALVLEDEEKQRNDRQRKKYEEKKHREQKNVVMDELLPKATGREARIEKKFAEAEQRRQREHSPETRDDVLMGGGDNFRSRLAARQKFQARRREEKQQKVADRVEQYEAKEKATMDALLAMAQASKKVNALWQPK